MKKRLKLKKSVGIVLGIILVILIVPAFFMMRNGVVNTVNTKNKLPMIMSEIETDINSDDYEPVYVTSPNYPGYVSSGLTKEQTLHHIKFNGAKWVYVQFYHFDFNFYTVVHIQVINNGKTTDFELNYHEFFNNYGYGHRFYFEGDEVNIWFATGTSLGFTGYAAEVGAYVDELYEYRFVANGKVVESNIVPYAYRIDIPAPPKKDKGIFNRWKADKGEDLYYNEEYAFYNYAYIYDNVTYTATYDEACELSFYDNGKKIDERLIYKGAELSYRFMPENLPATKDKIFIGWEDEDGNLVEKQVVNRDMKLTAKWLSNSDSTEFHKMTDFSDLQIGAHYIVVEKETNRYEDYNLRYTLAPNPVLGNAMIVAQTDKDYEDEILRVSLEADNVLTMTSQYVSSETKAYIRLEANNGQRLKLSYDDVFNSSGGEIDITMTYIGFQFRNSKRPLYFDRKNHSFYVYGIVDGFEIWTDAKPSEDLGEVQYVEYVPLSMIPLINQSEEMVIVYTDEKTGKSYALTAPDESGSNATEVKIDIVKAAVSKGPNFNDTTTALTINRSKAWTVNGPWEYQTNYPIDDTYMSYVTRNTLKQGDQYLWMSQTQMFSTDPSKKVYFYLDIPQNDLSKVRVRLHGTVDEEDRFLGWDETTQTFTTGNNPDNSIYVRIYGMNHNFVNNTYYRLTDLSKLKDSDKFIVVIPNTYIDYGPDGEKEYRTERYAIGKSSYGSTWLNPVYRNPDGTVTVSSYSGFLSEFLHGNVSSSSSKQWTFDYIQLNGGEYFYPQELPAMPFSKSARKVRFEYGNNNAEFYIRGNGENSYLGYVNGYYTAVGKDDPNKVPIEIYVLAEEDPIQVNYFDTEGWLKDEVYAQKQFTLDRPDDIYVKNGKKVPSGTKDSVLYSFVGWSTDSKYAGNSFLSIEDSANLFDYDDKTKAGSFKKEIRKKYSLIGNGNPEVPDIIDLTEYITDDQNYISLYPIYAVRGIDTVVTADEDGKPVIGISDWKPLQDDDSKYKNEEKEKWLGSVNIEVYKDGELWTKSSPMYFSYHNDNAVDLNIKFVWEELVAKYKGENQLYQFMSDNSVFPNYDQVGHFIIDGVYAVQGGSEDGLKYEFNWMTDHGGQLDNVAGGSTVKIYVTTKYDVRYYLNDILINNKKWTNKNYYTTEGTFNKFTADTVNAEYAVSKNKYKELMNKDIKEKNGSKVFKTNAINRGEYNEFSYFINDYENIIPIAISPKALINKGYTLISDSWILKDKDMNEVNTAEWSSKYEIIGTKYNTGNTIYAYKEDDLISPYEADSPYTFHLYAYTDSPQTNFDEIVDEDALNEEIESNEKLPNQPFTFDDSRIRLWFIMMALSTIAILLIIKLGKKVSAFKN